MANIYCFSGGSNTSPYDTWAKAATTLSTAVAASSANDTIWVSESHAETPSANQTYACPTPLRIICADDATGEPPSTPATTASIDGSATAGVGLDFTTGSVYMYGINLTVGGSTSTAQIKIANQDNTFYECESCTFIIPNTSATSFVQLGQTTTANRQTVITKNCTFKWGGTGQGLDVFGKWESIGDNLCDAAGTVPTVLIEVVGFGPQIDIYGANISSVNTTIFESDWGKSSVATLYNCSLNASVTIFSPTGASSGTAIVRDCASGDTHYSFQHINYRGNTVAGVSIYPTGGALYDGTNPVSWTITGTNATTSAPYYSEWIDVYHSGTSAITPYLESVRDGSATKFNDDEVWSEWMSKVTTTSTRASFFSERTRGVAGSALETSALGASDWTGEGGTAAFMKLRPDSSFTPAEIGHISARVGVSGAYTIIVDPFIRGLS